MRKITIELSDESEESLMIVDAVNSGRATAHAKTVSEIESAFENSIRLQYSATEEVMSKICAALRRTVP